MRKLSKELIGILSEIIILSVLNFKDSYGYEIVQYTKTHSGELIKWQVSSIYPVLKKLTEKELIKPYWETVESQRPRKYYTILDAGKHYLKEEKKQMESLQFSIKSTLG